jgi:hypothetical protein
MSNFTWIPFYKELAQKLLEYKDRQSELIDYLDELHNQKGLLVISTKDQDSTGQEIRLNEIDLFTFFATFNRGIKDEMRFQLLKEMKTKFGLISDVPSDFSGIPVFNNQKSWLFAFKKNRQAKDIPLLWEMAENVLHNPDHIGPDLFNNCLEIKGVGATYLTMGLFWINPEKFAACDAVIVGYLKNKGFTYSPVKNFTDYLAYIQNLKNFMPVKSFQELSFEAWIEAKEVKEPELQFAKIKYWAGGYHWGGTENKISEFFEKGIWQIGNSKDDEKRKSVIELINQVSKGDYIILKSYGGTNILTISGLGQVVGTSKSNEGILDINWVNKKQIYKGNPPSGKGAGNWWGTFSQITQQSQIQQFFTDQLMNTNDTNRMIKYWLYAPGPAAEMWEEFKSLSIIGIEVDALGDLKTYQDKPSIVKHLQDLENVENPGSKKNDATACDEFANKMSVGDVVIVKTKQKSLLGYGIVTSDYYFDDERQKYKSCRKVKWEKTGNWTTDFQLVQKTLTDITKYPTEHPGYKHYYERLMAIIEGVYMPYPKSLDKIKHSLNQILFGPPGTGKTYNSVNQALAIIDGEIPEDRELATKRFRELIKNGQIVFTTFHQSMCYEDFIEGIKPVEPENEGESISYSVIDGIFKQLTINSEFEYYKEGELKEKKDQKFILFDDYWNRLIADIESNKLAKVTTLSGKFLKIQTVTDKGNVVVKPEQKGALDYIVSYNRTKKLFDALSDLTKVRNIDKEFRQVIGGSNSTAYWGVLNHLKNYNFSNEQVLPDFAAKEYTYDQKKDLLLGWNGYIDAKFKVKPYVLIIDEINRGNVAQIFGELITLLEEDKRLGRTEELRVTLPYSKQKGFGVPSNLYLIGTMNTADRSVEALDSALRRRFTFIEMPPKYDLPELENEIIEGISLEEIMKTLNSRIEKLLDKDHLIGHSYFLSVDNLTDLQRIFHHNIIPLLQEYFYGDFAKIGLVLGEAFFDRYEIPKKTIFAKFTHDAADELNEKPVYRLKQSWAKGEFEKAIEEMVNP